MRYDRILCLLPHKPSFSLTHMLLDDKRKNKLVVVTFAGLFPFNAGGFFFCVTF